MKRFVFAFALASCLQPAEPADVRARISALVPPLGNGAAEVIDAVQASPGMTSFQRDVEIVDTLLPGGTPVLAKPDAPPDEPPGDALARWLNEHVFIDANYEGDGVYRVRGAAVCGDDADCARRVDEAEIRVRAQLDGDGLELTVMVGGGRAEPLAIALQPEQVTFVLDVAEARDAAVALGAEGIHEAAGRVSFRFGRLRERAWSATLSVEEDVRLTATTDGGPASLTVAARVPLATATVDLAAQTLAATVNVGPVALALPTQDLGVVGVDLRGLTADVSLADSLSVRRFGFGDGTSRLTLDGETLFALDWNAEAGRTVDLAFSQALGFDTLGMAPRLDVTLTTNFQPLADRGREVEPYLLDEIYDVHLGTALGFIAGEIAVLGEPLSIVARKAGASVTVPQGQCLVADPLTDGEHPLIGRLAARDCQTN